MSTKEKKLVYVAGPYRADTMEEVWDNLMNARAAGRLVWLTGHVPIVPHMNSFLQGGLIADEEFLDGDLVILERCDALLLIGTWPLSVGSKGEKEFAEEHNIPVFTLFGTLRDWLKEEEKK